LAKFAAGGTVSAQRYPLASRSAFEALSQGVDTRAGKAVPIFF
jgi:hypothetical protein